MNQIVHTDPILRRGKKVDPNLKGAKKLKAQAEGDWYVEYFFTDYSLNIIKKRVKVRGEINRIKDPAEKERQAQIVLLSQIKLLNGGYNPLNEEANKALRKHVISITGKEAVEIYTNSLKQRNLRKKSLQTYISKLNYFEIYFENKKLTEINAAGIQQFLTDISEAQGWNSITFNYTRQIVSALFDFLIKQKYLTHNPVNDIDKKIVRETANKNVPISQADLANIMRWLELNDPFTALFAKAIYYTCIRPVELRQIQLKMINLETKVIEVPGTNSKNGLNDYVVIDQSLLVELEKLMLERQPSDDYLFSSTVNIFGPNQIGVNTPYNRFARCLQTLGLDKRGYTLYSLKHNSNINRYLSGNWSLAELMVANRHSHISVTELYLKGMKLQVNVSGKIVPPLVY